MTIALVTLQGSVFQISFGNVSTAIPLNLKYMYSKTTVKVGRKRN